MYACTTCQQGSADASSILGEAHGLGTGCSCANKHHAFISTAVCRRAHKLSADDARGGAAHVLAALQAPHTRSKLPSAKGCCSASATWKLTRSARPCSAASALARCACGGAHAAWSGAPRACQPSSWHAGSLRSSASSTCLDFYQAQLVHLDASILIFLRAATAPQLIVSA